MNLLLSGLLVYLAHSAEVVSPDPNRPDLADLAEDRWEVMEEYESPFLVTMTATASDLTPAEAKKKVTTLLSQGKLPFPGTTQKKSSGVAITAENFPLPSYTVEGDQLEGIRDCTRDYCKMKLNNKEKGAVQDSKSKVQTYHQLVIRRLHRYLTKRELWGYEERGSNIPYVKKALQSAPFFPKTYPAVTQYLGVEFWKGAPPPPSLEDSFLRQEKMFMDFEKMQPTWRFGEVLVFKTANGGSLFAVIDVYSNHFFDSIFSFYEVIPWGKKTVLTVLDLMEVDELKKSAFIRLLFKGKMQEAVTTYQKKTLKALVGIPK